MSMINYYIAACRLARLASPPGRGAGPGKTCTVYSKGLLFSSRMHTYPYFDYLFLLFQPFFKLRLLKHSELYYLRLECPTTTTKQADLKNTILVSLS